MPNVRFVSEKALAEEFGTNEKLASGGDYGCDCAVFEGDLTNDDGDAKHPMFEDGWFYALAKQHDGDIGTVLVTGNVRASKDVFVSDRLMCLVVLGSIEAPSLRVFATEVFVGKDLVVGELLDRDRLVTVKGQRRIGPNGA